MKTDKTTGGGPMMANKALEACQKAVTDMAADSALKCPRWGDLLDPEVLAAYIADSQSVAEALSWALEYNASEGPALAGCARVLVARAATERRAVLAAAGIDE